MRNWLQHICPTLANTTRIMRRCLIIKHRRDGSFCVHAILSCSSDVKRHNRNLIKKIEEKYRLRPWMEPIKMMIDDIETKKNNCARRNHLLAFVPKENVQVTINVTNEYKNQIGNLFVDNQGEIHNKE